MQRIEHIAARDYSGSAERQEDHQQDRGGPEQGKPGGEGAAQAQAEYGQTNLVQADSEKQQIDHLRWPGVFKVADQPGLHQQQGKEQAIAQPAQRTLLQVETAGDEQAAEHQRQTAAEVGFNGGDQGMARPEQQCGQAADRGLIQRQEQHQGAVVAQLWLAQGGVLEQVKQRHDQQTADNQRIEGPALGKDLIFEHGGDHLQRQVYR